MWKCLKLLRFSIQTTEKLFMPNGTFDSNTVFGARDSPEVGNVICVRSARSDKHAARTIMNKFNVIDLACTNSLYHFSFKLS